MSPAAISAGGASGSASHKAAASKTGSEKQALSEGSGPDILKPDSHRASDGLKIAVPTRPLLDASRRLLLDWRALPPSQCIESATRPSHVAVSQFGSPFRDEMKGVFHMKWHARVTIRWARTQAASRPVARGREGQPRPAAKLCRSAEA